MVPLGVRSLAACMAAAAALVLPATAAASHAEPLRAQYHLDDLNFFPFGDTGAYTTTSDSSGHNLTLSGKPSGPTLIDDGKFGKAFRFSGSAGGDDDGMRYESSLLQPETVTALAWV